MPLWAVKGWLEERKKEWEEEENQSLWGRVTRRPLMTSACTQAQHWACTFEAINISHRLMCHCFWNKQHSKLHFQTMCCFKLWTQPPYKQTAGKIMCDCLRANLEYLPPKMKSMWSKCIKRLLYWAETLRWHIFLLDELFKMQRVPSTHRQSVQLILGHHSPLTTYSHTVLVTCFHIYAYARTQVNQCCVSHFYGCGFCGYFIK